MPSTTNGHGDGSSMEHIGMEPTKQVQTTPGGEPLDEHEIAIGPATYVVQRVFQGSKTVRDLIVARLEHVKLDDSPFDDHGSHDV